MKEETLIIEVNECKAHRKQNCPICLAHLFSDLKDLQRKETKG